MENRGKPENQQQQQDSQKEKNKSFVIRIPSYEEVAESSQPKTTPQSLFNPSPSFTQAFNFIKNSEFYTTPPAPSSSQPSEVSHPPSRTPPPRQIIQSEGPSTSVSSAGGNRIPSLLAIDSELLHIGSIMLGPLIMFPYIASHGGLKASAMENMYLWQWNLVTSNVVYRYKGNPLLKHIRNVRWAFADIVCDYLLGQNSCALYLSLRYHLLHPDYLYFRIRELQKNFKLRVVLCHVDVEDVVKPLHEVTKTALLHDCTLLCGWSLEECGRYLETIKVYENKPADLIQGQMDMDYLSRLPLLSFFYTESKFYKPQSLSHIMDASMEDLARCPGIGERKVKRLYDTFHEPFKRAVPNPAHTAENPIDKHAGLTSESERNEDEKETPEGSKQRKKEPELSVKSALKAAFAKYSGRKRKTPVPDEREEKIVVDQQVNSDEDFAS
ncbi:hypothetical protein DH2020_048613 [Rehmannia glutinosa]|uniref:ERCC1-like central domain-containing protein n=1 Tax=Rehmannia glutinosa TaxID=99300 RepID=A0ABR0U584_REHGL